MSELTLYEVTPRQAHKFVCECVEAHLVPFVQGSPGVGKSSIMRNVSDSYGLHMIDHRLSTSAPEDLTGLPRFVNDRATFSPFDIFPTRDTELPAGKQGWMLFFDEFNAAPKSVQAAAYKVVLDRMIGQHKLNDRVLITAAGNLATDRAIVNSLSTAMQSRLVHLTLRVDFQEWLEDVAYPENYDSRIIAFLSWKPSLLLDFKPDHNDKTFCCPRTWEFLNRLIKGKEVTHDKAALYGGTITSGTAVEFTNFTKVYDSLPKLRDILQDPLGTPLPGDPPVRYAVITFLQEKVEDDSFEAITQYVNRMTAEFRVLFFRGLMIRKPILRAHPAFRSAMVELSRYLND
jgi:hypothetical protein